MAKKKLTIELLKAAAKKFAQLKSKETISDLYGVNDGKAIGTYIEHTFKEYLSEHAFDNGSAAEGLDFPDMYVDIKTTSIKQPQSSCPFKSARQKIFGLGYNILLFVYEKTDNHKDKTVNLNFLHVVFVDADRTADHTITNLINETIRVGGTKEDILAILSDRNLPVDDIEASQISDEIMARPPKIGYLTISNALQWRLQYKRVIDAAGTVAGIIDLKGSQE